MYMGLYNYYLISTGNQITNINFLCFIWTTQQQQNFVESTLCFLSGHRRFFYTIIMNIYMLIPDICHKMNIIVIYTHTHTNTKNRRPTFMNE